MSDLKSYSTWNVVKHKGSLVVVDYDTHRKILHQSLSESGAYIWIDHQNEIRRETWRKGFIAALLLSTFALLIFLMDLYPGV